MSEPAAHSVRLDRVASRVLVLDGDGRLLLMRGVDPARPDAPHWFNVGALVGPFHEDVTAFGFGEYWVHQPQQYFAVRVPAGWEPEPAALEPIEAEVVDRWSWWTLDELRAHAAGRPHSGPGAPGEPVYPAELPDLLARLLPDAL